MVMVTVRDKESGMEIKGEHIRTSKGYVFLNIDGRTQCFAKNEWEVVRRNLLNPDLGSVKGCEN